MHGRSPDVWRQPLDMQDRLQTLDGELDLPSQAIKRSDDLDRKLLALERGQEDDVIGGGDCSGIGATLVLAARPPRLGARFRSRRGGFLMITRRISRGSNRLCALWTRTGMSSAPCLLASLNSWCQSIGLPFAVICRLFEVRRTSTSAPSASVFLIPSGCGNPRSPRRYLAWRHGEPIEPLALLGRRNDSVDNARKARIVAQVQPPDPVARPFEPADIDDPDRSFRRFDADLFGNASEPLLARALQPISRVLELMSTATCDTWA